MYDYFKTHLDSLRKVLPDGNFSLNAFNTITVLKPDFKNSLPYKYTINYNTDESSPVVVSFLTEADMYNSLPEVLTAIRKQNATLEEDYSNILNALEQSVRLLKEVLVAQKSWQEQQFTKLEKQMEVHKIHVQHLSKSGEAN